MKKKEIKQYENEVVIHQNVARLRGTLSPVQSRSMLSILKRANEQVAENSNILDFKIPTYVFLEDIQNKDTSGLITQRLHNHLRKLMVQTFTWGSEEEINECIFMQQIKVTNEEVTFTFSNYIREHIKPISNALIVKDFELIQSFRSEYARQLYKHLMMWEGKQTLYLSIKDLKDFLGVPNTNSYKRMDVLKRKVINVAVKEINEKCPWMDLKYSNRTKPRSRIIEGFDFGWFSKEKKKTDSKEATEQARLFDAEAPKDYTNLYGMNCKVNGNICEHLLMITPLTDGSINCSFRSGENYHFESVKDLLKLKI